MIFSIINQKGGVGKTTSVLNLGVIFANMGKKVLLIDVDPQANLTSGIGVTLEVDDQNIYDVLINKAKASNVIKPTRIANLDILPSHISLAGAEVELVSQFSRESILKKALEEIKNEYDYIFLDCPPSLGLLTVNSLVSADYVLIPVQAEYFALEGLGQLVNTIKLIKSNLNYSLEIGGVILTMYDTRTNLSKDVANEIKNFFGDKVFESTIPRNIKLSEAPSHGLPITEYAPNSTGATAYTNLATEIINHFENNKMIRPIFNKKS